MLKGNLAQISKEIQEEEEETRYKSLKESWEEFQMEFPYFLEESLKKPEGIPEKIP